MSLQLGQPALAGFVALAAAPVLIHLFARRRPRDAPFPSLRFLRETLREQARLQRPRHWLILLLRTLGVLALVGVFLDPKWFPENPAAAPGAARHVVVLVDLSASMAWSDGGGARFAAACAEADRVLADLAPGDRANVVWLGAQPDAVYPEPGTDREFLRSAVRRARVRPEAGDVRAALALAARQLEPLGGGEIILISDFQATAWPETLPELPAGVRLVTLRAGRGEAVNFALTNLACSPALPLAGETVALQAEVANFSPEARRVPVLLEAGGARQTQEVLVPAWGRAGALFRLAVPADPVGGALPVRVSLAPDAFPADDTRQLAVPVRAHLRCALSGTDEPTLLAWERALRALGWARVERAAPGDGEADAWFVAGWDGARADALAREIRAGATAVILPAPGLPAPTWRILAARDGGAADAAAPAADVAEARRLAPPARLTIPRADDPVFAVFDQGAFGDPAAATLQALVGWSAPPAPGGEVLLATAGAPSWPVLARWREGGALYFWGAPLAPGATDWTSRGAFVPLLGEMLLGARAGPRGPSAPQEILSGALPSWQPGRAHEGGDIALTTTDGGRLEILPGGAPDAPQFLARAAPPPGLYQWRDRGVPQSWLAVNLPAAESDLRTREPPADAGVARAAGAGAVRALRDGVMLWPWLLTAAGLMFFMEGGVAAWTGRK